jgi:hypothetical protein
VAMWPAEVSTIYPQDVFDMWANQIIPYTVCPVSDTRMLVLDDGPLTKD